MIESVGIPWYALAAAALVVWWVSDGLADLKLHVVEARRVHEHDRELRAMLRDRRRLARLAPDPRPRRPRPCPPGCRCVVAQGRDW